MDGHLLGGLAPVAWSAEYGVSGLSTFIVNQVGVVYEKDPQTADRRRRQSHYEVRPGFELEYE